MQSTAVPFILGVAGGSGSGKSWLVQELTRRLRDLNPVVLHQDSYYRDLRHLDPESRARSNFDEPDAVDFALLADHLSCLRRGAPVRPPLYDLTSHLRQGWAEEVGPAPIVIADGILILAVEEVAQLLDLALFVETPDDLRLEQRMRRDLLERGRSAESVLQQWHATVQPMHRTWVQPSAARAHLRVHQHGLTSLFCDLMAGGMRRFSVGADPGPGE